MKAKGLGCTVIWTKWRLSFLAHTESFSPRSADSRASSWIMSKCHAYLRLRGNGKQLNPSTYISWQRFLLQGIVTFAMVPNRSPNYPTRSLRNSTFGCLPFIREGASQKRIKVRV